MCKVWFEAIPTSFNVLQAVFCWNSPEPFLDMYLKQSCNEL